MGCCSPGCGRLARWSWSASRAPALRRGAGSFPARGRGGDGGDRPAGSQDPPLAGQSDPVDAEAAARAALAGHRTGTPKHRDGQVEALRALRVARRSAVGHRADVQRRIKALTSPRRRPCVPCCVDLCGLRDRDLITRCADDQPVRAVAADPDTATRLALRSLARRHRQLSTEIDELDALITPLTTTLNPTLIARKGIGPDTAGAAGHHRGQPRAAAIRGRVRHAVRHRAPARLQR
jgi:hypothetical protein